MLNFVIFDNSEYEFYVISKRKKNFISGYCVQVDDSEAYSLTQTNIFKTKQFEVPKLFNSTLADGVHELKFFVKNLNTNVTDVLIKEYVSTDVVPTVKIQSLTSDKQRINASLQLTNDVDNFNNSKITFLVKNALDIKEQTFFNFTKDDVFSFDLPFDENIVSVFVETVSKIKCSALNNSIFDKLQKKSEDYSVFGKFVERVQRVMENHIYHKNKSLREFEVIANEVVKEVSKIPENIIIDINARIVNLYEHTVMVTLVSVFVARLLHLDQVRQYNIAVGALLHDLGLRYITTGYVNRDWEKEDPIEAFEYKKHTILGYSALDEESWIPEVSKKMVLFHHERLDGSGFPMRRRDFAMECRIIQACDAFDSYITGMECIRIPLQDAIGKIQEGIIHKYDRKVVETLLSKIAYYPVGTVVKMSNQAEGIVVLQTEDPKCPVVLDFHSGESEKKYNLMLQKDISILQII